MRSVEASGLMHVSLWHGIVLHPLLINLGTSSSSEAPQSAKSVHRDGSVCLPFYHQLTLLRQGHGCTRLTPAHRIQNFDFTQSHCGWWLHSVVLAIIAHIIQNELNWLALMLRGKRGVGVDRGCAQLCSPSSLI
eukprot:1146522-Pelagomonas_calceolata.AAC.2